VAQRWLLTYLERSDLSVVPYLSLSPDEPDSVEQMAAEGAESARYVLTWAGPADVFPSAAGHAVWQNGKFQLTPIDSVRDFLFAGRGWYPTEYVPASPLQWQHRFRWLRSDGEVFLLNASGKALRLELTIVSGYGFPEPERSVSFALNGRQFDEVHTSGTATVITKPFRATGFLNRLSISVPDVARPIPNPWGLFRRWVPKDGRRLNIAVSNMRVLGEQDYSSLKMPCAWNSSRAEDWELPGLNGIYSDNWIAGEAHVALEPCDEPGAISIRGFLPGLPGSNSPFPVVVSVNGIPRTFELANAGAFTLTVPLPQAAAQQRVCDIGISSPRTFVPAEMGLGPDRRRLSIQLNAVEIQGRQSDGASPRAKSAAKAGPGAPEERPL
jgi:hypothetical protein